MAINLDTQLFQSSNKVIPGGVNSPVRAFGSVGGTPVFIDHAKGPYLYSSDGKEYIDYVGSWGPMIIGHANDAVINSVKQAVERGLSYGAPTVLETKLAEKIISLMPCVEKIRMVNSGTEATMSAIRLARGFTNRNKIIKFIGCYHGHSDSLLVKAGSGLLTFDKQNNAASSKGVPETVVADTLLADFNNLDSVQTLFANYKDQIAAVILEPIPGNMNMIMPEQKFLNGLRELCSQHGSVLIFDEVMSGFRVALGGASEVYNIKPDLVTLGKVIGGGMPVGAFGGRADIMDRLSPVGDVYQAGTLSGNPIAMTAGLATLDVISQPGFFDNLSGLTQTLVTGIAEVMSKYNIPFCYNYLGGMFGFFFTKDSNIKTISNFDEVVNCNNQLFNKFFHGMLNRGVYLAPSAFEAGFVSSSHSSEIIAKTISIAEEVISSI